MTARPEHSGAVCAVRQQRHAAQQWIRRYPKNRAGHPIQHEFTRSIPVQPVHVCHIHPGTNMVATYFGYTWWDNETDGEHMYPAKQHRLRRRGTHEIAARNPEGARCAGKWGGHEVPRKRSARRSSTSKLKHTQFADFHGHGWVFRAVYKRDRKGNLLDADDKVVPHDDPEKFNKAVHLKDIHLEKGMHCVDCHFEQDTHGNGKLYGETRNAIEIDCVDCHGTIDKHANADTTRPGRARRRHAISRCCARPGAQRRFYWQKASCISARWWSKIEAMGSGPGDGHHHARQRSLQREVALCEDDAERWPDLGRGSDDESTLAHANSEMTCYHLPHFVDDRVASAATSR